MIDFNPAFYSKTPEDLWDGRNDGTDLTVQRWHQRVICIDLQEQQIPLTAEGQKGIALIGFACDEGVRRNNGRVGARQGPYHFRKASVNLPVHLTEDQLFVDLGDIVCEATEMEEAQDALASLVSMALTHGYQPLVIGGGHEVAYGHYKGISQFTEQNSDPEHTIGIINFDAHFDLREPGENGFSSGTGFLQIANDCKTAGKEFRYLPAGIQLNSNTRQLFDTATALNVNYITTAQFAPAKQQELIQNLQNFIADSTHIYVTICMDVFSSSVAPGVSAAAYSGLFPDPFFFSCLTTIMDSGKVISTDIAEYNPIYDEDQRTAKLAAALAFSMISK